MIDLLLAARGLRSGGGRVAYLTLTLALAAAAWILLSVLAAPFLPAAAPAQQRRVTVAIDAANRGQALPLRYVRRAEALPGVAGVIYSTAVVVTCRDTAAPVSIQAFGGSRAGLVAWRRLWPESSPALRAMQERWFDDPMGVLLGSRTAADCQWQAGMSVAPDKVFSKQPVAIHISGVRPKQKNPIANIVAFGHYDYFNRAAVAAGSRNTVDEIVVLPSAPGQVNVLVARIEEAFAHDDPPIHASTDATVQNALARYGQAQYVLGAVMLATLLCTLLVCVSVLAHAVAERRRQLAILLVLGFPRATLWRAFVLETASIVLLGVGLGLACSTILLGLLPERMGLFFNGFRVPAWAWWGLPLWVACLAGVALILPTRMISRLRPVDLRVA